MPEATCRERRQVGPRSSTFGRRSGWSATAAPWSSAAPVPATRCPQRFIDELATVFAAEGRPRDLTTVRVVGIGDFADRGFSQLGLSGLVRRTIGSNIGNEPRSRGARRGERDRVVLVPAGRAVAAHARDRRGTTRAGDPGGAGDLRRSAADRRQAERQDDRGPRRGRDAARSGVAAVPRLPDRCRRHPRDDRRRGRQPHDGGRGRPGRDARDGHGRAEQRRHRHRPGPPARDARQPADARREGPRRPDRPRLRRSGPVADVHHAGLALLRRGDPSAGPTGTAAAARRSQGASPGGRCSSSRRARSATWASGSASSSAGSPGRRASPTSWC